MWAEQFNTRQLGFWVKSRGRRLLPICPKVAEQGESVGDVRNRLLRACRGLPTRARAYAVGGTALLIVSDNDGSDPRTLAWLEYESVKVCFVATAAEQLSVFAPLFGGEFPAFEYFGVHESLEQAWSYLSRGGIGAPQNGQHHLNRSLCVYAKACLRNLRSRTSPAPAAPRSAVRGAPRRTFVRRVTRETRTREGYQRVVVEEFVQEQAARPPRGNYSERRGGSRRARGRRSNASGRGALPRGK